MADDMRDAEEKEAVTDLSNPDVVTKYRDAANIANEVLRAVLTQVAPGRLVADICEFGDAQIEKMVSGMYKSKKVEKGIAFPTCISVNECVGHYSPFKAESKVLAEGDSLKIDLGVHFDGFAALVAHTVVLGASAAAPVTGPRADVIAAAHTAAEVALRLIKPGNTNTQVTAAISRVAEAFGVKAIAGVTCNQVKQFALEGEKSIAIRADPEAKVEECTFAAHESYVIDVALTTGEGKARELEARPTVFRRMLDQNYHLKMAASRRLINEVNRRFPAFPFSLRALGDDKDFKLGLTEAVKHNVLVAYPVVYEREGAATASFRFTALLLPGGTLKATGLELPEGVRSEVKLPEDLATLLATDSHTSKKAKKKAAKASGGAGEMTD